MADKTHFASPFLQSVDFARRMEGRDNNFNLIRVLAAFGVIVSHAFPITYGSDAVEPLEALFGRTLGWFCVAVFFFISGLLLARSLDRSRSITLWCKARVMRIFPGLVVSLLLTALVAGAFLTSLSPQKYWASPEVYTFIAKNTLLAFMQYELPGVFANNPYPDAVNGSLWTLFYEVSWYFILISCATLVLALNKSAPLSRVFMGVLAALVAVALVYGYYAASPANMCGAVCTRIEHMFNLGLFFVLGIGAWVIRERIRINLLSLALVWALVFILKGTIIADYALVLAIVMSVLYAAYSVQGGLLRYNKLGDYSYGMYIYAFPVQQAVAQYFSASGWLFNVMLTLPIVLVFAVWSWHFIEQPALRLAKAKIPAELRPSHS